MKQVARHETPAAPRNQPLGKVDVEEVDVSEVDVVVEVVDVIVVDVRSGVGVEGGLTSGEMTTSGIPSPFRSPTALDTAVMVSGAMIVVRSSLSPLPLERNIMGARIPGAAFALVVVATAEDVVAGAIVVVVAGPGVQSPQEAAQCLRTESEISARKDTEQPPIGTIWPHSISNPQSWAVASAIASLSS